MWINNVSLDDHYYSKILLLHFFYSVLLVEPYVIFEDTKNHFTAMKAHFKDEYFTKIIVVIKLAYTQLL